MDCFVHFLPFLLKTLFTKSVSFFYIVESFVVAILAAYITAGVFIYTAITGYSPALISFILLYLVYIFLFNLIYTTMAIRQVKRYGFSFEKGDRFRLLLTVLYDIFVHRFVTMYFVMYGSVAYFFNRDWKKVARTGRNYETDVAS